MEEGPKYLYQYPWKSEVSEQVEAEKLLLEFKKRFDPLLKEYLQGKVREANEVSSQAVVLVKEIARLAKNGGKRVRPMFVYAGYLAAGGRSVDAVILASLSVELLHTFALIHDDIIDRSPLRRDEPTTHKAFESFHKSSGYHGDRKWYGLSSAILTGDLAATYANEILNIAPFPHERVRRAKYYFNKMKEEAEYGEYLDVLSGIKEKVSEDEVLKILEYKTGKYTVERPLHIGAALAAADSSVYEVFTAYAVPFGQAFQTQDDILGTFGDEETIGKPNDSDIKEGKKTLLVVKAFERASRQQKKLLKQVLGDRDADNTKIEQVREIMRETGALSYAVSLSNYLLNQSRYVAQSAKIDDYGRQYLLAAVDYLQSRPL